MLPAITWLKSLENSALAHWVAGSNGGSSWVFPIIETVHVLSLSIVFGSIAMMDLRLLGISARNSPASRLSAEVLPWTWTAFVLTVSSGFLMFSSYATGYWENPRFQLKLLCILLAGANMLVFHFGVYRRVAGWDTSLPPPPAARVAGALSLALWITVIVLGRWVGFT